MRLCKDAATSSGLLRLLCDLRESSMCAPGKMLGCGAARVSTASDKMQDTAREMGRRCIAVGVVTAGVGGK